MDLDQYRELSKKFNKLSFRNKIIFMRDNPDKLMFGSDCNWWIVKVVDKEIQEKILDIDEIFDINNEWGHNEMYDLVNLLGIKIGDV